MVLSKMNTPVTFTPVEQLLRESLIDIVVEKHEVNLLIKAVFLFSRSLPFFVGHFPTEPIFPAVLQLAIVRFLSSDAIDTPLKNVSVGKTKFSHIIRPEEKVMVNIDLSLQHIEYEAKFKFFNESKVASSGSIKYEKEG